MFYLNAIRETAYGFKTKLLFFMDRIEKLRLKLGKEKNDLRILDIGCGNGRMVTLPLGEQGYAVIGIDAHAPTIEQARKENHFKNVEFEVGDLKEALLRQGFGGQAEKKFDVVVLSDILEHLSHPEDLLNEIKNFLNPHGIVLISIPNGYGPFEIENFVLKKTGLLGFGRAFRRKSADAQTLNAESGHVQFFTQKSFEKLARGAGFKINVFKKGSFLCGPVSARFLSVASTLERLNVKMGEFLPAGMCSVWYYEITLRESRIPSTLELQRTIKNQESGNQKSGIDRHPRLLIISGSAFNPLSGGGITFTNLFKGWPKNKIACVHNDKIEPTKNICDKYFHLGAEEFKWQFPFSIANWFGSQEGMEKALRGTGEEVSLRAPSLPRREAIFLRGLLRRFASRNGILKKLAPFFQRIIGNEIPTRVNISPELEKFIEDFRPQVIYTILGSLPYVHLVRQIAQKYNLPLVIHMMDDWPAVRYRGILDFYRHRRMDMELRALIKKATACLAICDAMAEAYGKRYGREWKAFHNALDAETWLKKSRKNWHGSSPFKLLYAGALMPDSQLESVKDVADCVVSLYKTGLDIEFKIYAPWYFANAYRDELERGKCVKVFDAPETMDIESLFTGADLLLLPVNFDEASVKYIRYSMPTKVPAYMFSGTPTLAYGPASVASIKYAQQWAYCVANRDKNELADAIKKLALEEPLRKSLALRAQELAKERHYAVKVRADFHGVLIDAANPSR